MTLFAKVARPRALHENAYVPAYKFSWSNLPQYLTTSLAKESRLDQAGAVDALTRRYRARPGEEFIHDTWDSLQRNWLGVHQNWRRAVAAELREKGLGDHARATRSSSGEMEYLASCRRSASMKDIVLAQFLAFGSIDHHEPEVGGTLDDMDEAKGWRLLAAKPSPVRPFAPYQHQTDAWAAMTAARPLVGNLLVLPTGAGKTVTAIRWLLSNVLSDPSQRRVLWIAHRGELVEQAADTIELNMDACRRAEPLGVRCISGLHGNPASTLIDPHADVVCATIQSLNRAPEVVAQFFARNSDAFVVVDEAHHAAAKSYIRLLDAARAGRDVEVLGLTATPTRTDEDDLGRLRAQFPDGVVYQVEASRLVNERILARPICATVPTGQDFEIDFSESELAHLRRFAELSTETLERIAKSTSRNKLIADYYESHQGTYGKTLIFGASVAHCFTLAKEFSDRGIAADYVAYQRGDNRTNEDVLAEFRAGRIDVLMSVTKLTEGIDLPLVETVFLVRPTSSHILLSQMVGRALRGPKAGGTESAHIVSFEDHWAKFADWLDPIEFLDGDYIEPDGQGTVPGDTIRVPWELYLEIARLRQMPGGAEAIEAAHLVGYYDLTSALPSPGLPEYVPVFDHQVEACETLLQASDAETADLAPDQVVELFFRDTRDPLPSARSVLALMEFAALGGTPELRLFEDTARFDPTLVAERCGDSISELQDEVDRVFETTTAGAIWPDKPSYFNAVTAAHASTRWKAQGLDEVVALDLAGEKKVPEPFDWDLRAICDEVAAQMGLAKEPPPIRFSDRPMKRDWAFYRYEPAEIVLNRVLATKSVSEATIRFLVYHELLHRELPQSEGHSARFRNLEKQFNGWMEANAELDTWRDMWSEG